MRNMLLLLLLLCTVGSAEKLLFVGFAENELNEYRDRFEKRVYQVWGRDTLLSMIDRSFAAYMKDRLAINGELVLTDDVVPFFKGHGYDDIVIAVPSVVSFDFEPKRTGFLFWGTEVVGTLKVQYSFYDIESRRELYITEIVSETKVRKRNLAPWRDLEKEVVLSLKERNDMTNVLIDDSVYESEKVLKEVLRIKKGQKRVSN